MNKEKLEAKLHNYEERLKDVAKAIKETREQLDEKPKLRHGDFGVGYTGDLFFLTGNGEKAVAHFEEDEAECWGVNTLAGNYIRAKKFGNIFDLMKDWGGDFEKWESKPAYKDAISIVIEKSDVGGIFFGNAGNAVTFEFENIYEIWCKLGQMIMTLKRKENSCS